MNTDKRQNIKKRRTFLQSVLGLIVTGTFNTLHAPFTLAKTLSSSLKYIKGKIINRSDSNYLRWWASMTWYIYKPKRYPDIIVQASNENDVIETINFARYNGMKISVRSTGHNPAKAVIRDCGILLDLSQLRSVEVDPESHTAWIQPGIRSEELLNHTLRHKLVFPAAHTGIVGLGGYLLGGGIGWNMPELGVACRSILAAEIITAEGKKISVSANKNQELHWAIRGVGTGFFGAVVRYKIQLYPAHKLLALNKYVIPIEKMNDAIDAFIEIDKSMSNRLEIFI